MYKAEYSIEDRVRIVNVPRFSKHKAFAVQELLERGWEGQQADKAAAAGEIARRQEEDSAERRQARLKMHTERAKAKLDARTPSRSAPSTS